jgi:hypothetical protein
VAYNLEKNKAKTAFYFDFAGKKAYKPSFAVGADRVNGPFYLKF